MFGEAQATWPCLAAMHNHDKKHQYILLGKKIIIPIYQPFIDDVK